VHRADDHARESAQTPSRLASFGSCCGHAAHRGGGPGRLCRRTSARRDPAGRGVRGWQRAAPFGPWTIDIAFPDLKLAIEVDGWAWHVEVDRFRADRHKGNALTRAGWILLRFTWHDLMNRPMYVLSEIGAALAAAA
jgi:hypothetical protein